MAQVQPHITINLKHKWFWLPLTVLISLLVRVFPASQGRIVKFLMHPVLKYCVEIS